MTTNPNGLLIQAQGIGGSQRALLLDHIQKANYRTVSVLDDFQLCRDIKTLLPDCVVVFRDSNFEPKPGPNDVQALLDLLGGIQSHDTRIVIMVNCEQGFNADRVNMWANMIVAADALGWKLCVGNVAPGSVKCGQGSDPNEWLQAKRLFDVMAARPGHYLGFHDYTKPFAWAVTNGTYGDPQKPPERVDWTLPQWHIGRNCQGIVAACKALKVDLPHCIVTEALIDEMGDIQAHFPDKADGYKLLRPRWNDWFPGKDAGDVLADMHIWAWEHVYAPLGFVIGLHTFCYGDASGADKWANYRVDNDPRYLARMETYRSIEAPYPKRTPTTETPVVIQPPPAVPPAIPTLDPTLPLPKPVEPPITIDARSYYARLADLHRQIAEIYDLLDLSNSSERKAS